MSCFRLLLLFSWLLLQNARAAEPECLTFAELLFCKGDRVSAPDPFWRLPQVELGTIVALNEAAGSVTIDYEDYNGDAVTPVEHLGVLEGCVGRFCVGDSVRVPHPLWPSRQARGRVIAVLPQSLQLDVDLDSYRGHYRFDERDVSK